MSHLLIAVSISAQLFFGIRVVGIRALPHCLVAVLGGLAGYLGLRIALLAASRRAGPKNRVLAYSVSALLLSVFYITSMGPAIAIHTIAHCLYPSLYLDGILLAVYRPIMPLFEVLYVGDLMHWYISKCGSFDAYSGG